MNLLRYSILAFLCLCSSILSAQDKWKPMPIKIVHTQASSDLKYIKHLTVNNGFSRNSVFKVTQDEKGFVWFGLWDGLYRYDGTKLVNIAPSISKKRKTEPSIFNIIYDGKQSIWMASASGITIWDDELQKKHSFTEKTTEGKPLRGVVSQMYKDKFRNIWIITDDKNLYVYSLDKKILKEITSILNGRDNNMNDIYVDKTNKVWICTDHGILSLRGKTDATQNPFHTTDWKIEEDSLFNQFTESFIWKIYQDNQLQYWIGTDNGIRLISKQTEEEGSLQILEFDNYPVETNHIKVNTFTEFGNHIIVATNHGLFTYSKHDSVALWHLPDYTKENRLNDKSITDICIDKENGIWISSFYGGINYLHPTNTNFSKHFDLNKYIHGHVISGITEDNKGNIWMGVEDNGVCYWNRTNNTIQNFDRSSGTPYVPSFHNVQSIYADSDKLYVGMYQGGMDVVDLKSYKHEHFNTSNTSPDQLPNHVYSFHKLDKETMLVGGIDGLYRFNTQTKQVKKVKYVEGKVNCIVNDEEGDIWVSTLLKGFYWYSLRDNEWKHYLNTPHDSIELASYSINTILPMNPSIYIGTQGNGLWVFNKNTKEFRKAAAQTLKNTIIFKILQKGEILWITTNKGLYSYNIINERTKQYTVGDGLSSNQFKENSGIIASDNLFIIGGLNGFNCFRPAELKSNPVKPQVMLTDFYLFNQSADIHDEDCPLKQSISYTDHIDLNQKHHSFAFKLSSSCYSDFSKNKFEYKLEPFEKDWQRTHGRSNMASYTNLPAGKYVFHVRTANGDEIWSDEKCISITIHPYWWLSWPMKTLYALISLAIIINFIVRYRNKKKEEMHFFQMEKEQEVYESKMKFFTCMVHEIRTPLTLILGPLHSAMGKTQKTVEEVLPDLQIIERNGRRLLSLVNQLMDFRKVETRSFSVQMNIIDIKELIWETAKDFRYYNTQKAVKFEFSFPKESCWAKIDREGFTKVLINLLSNAMKFTKDLIRVSLSRTADGKMWELSVLDNGNGIDMKDQEAIFESFYQVHQDLPGDYVGTGIGLFVVRHLLKLQGGDIHVESCINKGAKFIVNVLYAETPEGSPADDGLIPEDFAIENENENMALPSNSAKKRLLIAEDNEEMRNYIASLFIDKYDIDTFENGKTAYDATQTITYDLVITDLMMPIMDGISLCRKLKRQSTTCHIPIIILTAKDDELSQKEGFESEADMYVTKPFSPEVLQSRVKSILKNREHLRQQFYTEPETTAEVLYTNNSDKDFLEKLDGVISQRLSDCNLPIDELAANMAMGRSVFYQKVKGVTGLTPNDYIRTFRLKKAVALFQRGETRINEVCYRVGFSSPSYFTKRFTLQFGISPSDYLKKNDHAKKSDGENKESSGSAE